jgi:adenosine deaminase
MTARDFACALSDGDIRAVRAFPKADLHTHGFFKADREYVFHKTGRDIVPIDTPLSSMDEMHAWVNANIGSLFGGQEGRSLGIEANFVGALKDGVSRIEFGDDVWMVTQSLGSPHELVDSIVRVHHKIAPQIEWIPQLGISRHCPISALVSGWRLGWNWGSTRC